MGLYEYSRIMGIRAKLMEFFMAAMNSGLISTEEAFFYSR
jgi:hypothetical protein